MHQGSLIVLHCARAGLQLHVATNDFCPRRCCFQTVYRIGVKRLFTLNAPFYFYFVISAKQTMFYSLRDVPCIFKSCFCSSPRGEIENS
jgi:hypothetical protein